MRNKIGSLFSEIVHHLDTIQNDLTKLSENIKKILKTLQ